MKDEEKIKFLTEALEQAKAQVDELMQKQKEWLLDKPPTKLMVIPALMKAAGWVRKKEWVGFTDKEIDMWTDDEIDTWNIFGYESLREFVRAIEAKLKERNT